MGTVRTHLHHIYGKLGVAGQTEAILEAQRQKLVEPAGKIGGLSLSCLFAKERRA